jgi:hypothetical protein
MIPSCTCPPGPCPLEPIGCTNRDYLRTEGSRYLYRNVAAEARKRSGLEKHLPQVRGW